MTRQRDILKFLRILAQAAVLFAMFTPMVASAMTNRFVIVDSDGNRTRGPLSDFRVDMIGPDPQAALLLPAVQAAREAARRMQDAACADEKLRTVLIRTEHQTIKLRGVKITSYSLGSLDDGSNPPVEDFALNYEKIEMQWNDTGESSVFDCRKGTCVCVGDGL